MKPKGFLLLSAMFVISILFLIGASLANLALSGLQRNQSQINSLKAFYLAEAGIEIAQQKLKNNPACFTDRAHYPSDDLSWLQDAAAGTIESLGEGYFKAVKEEGKPLIYSLGVVEKSNKVLARSIIKARYEADPLRLIGYSLL